MGGTQSDRVASSKATVHGIAGQGLAIRPAFQELAHIFNRKPVAAGPSVRRNFGLEELGLGVFSVRVSGSGGEGWEGSRWWWADCIVVVITVVEVVVELVMGRRGGGEVGRAVVAERGVR